jgi:hypothetical protein
MFHETETYRSSEIDESGGLLHEKKAELTSNENFFIFKFDVLCMVQYAMRKMRV